MANSIQASVYLLGICTTFQIITISIYNCALKVAFLKSSYIFINEHFQCQPCTHIHIL